METPLLPHQRNKDMWDIALNTRHTLCGGLVTSDDETVQRIWIRLNRELGEWFLNTEVGLPWYQEGYGILGSKPAFKNEIDLLIRREILNTVGVDQILKFNSLFLTGTRVYDVFCSVLLQSFRVVTISFSLDMHCEGKHDMPLIPADFIEFEDGRTLQELYDSGELKGDKGEPGRDGVNGTSATIAIGSTMTLSPGSSASVINSGTSNAAIFDFGIPAGVQGEVGPKGDTGETGPEGTPTLWDNMKITGSSPLKIEKVDSFNQTEISINLEYPELWNNLEIKGLDPISASAAVIGDTNTIDISMDKNKVLEGLEITGTDPVVVSKTTTSDKTKVNIKIDGGVIK